MFMFLSLFACLEPKDDTAADDTAAPDDTAVAADSFAGMDFVLHTAEGYTPVSQSIRIAFSDDNQFSFAGDCNSMSGEYSLDGDVFGLLSISGTEIGCAAELMDEDSWLTTFFGSSPTIEFDGESMVFTGSEATLTFIDEEIAIPARELIGTVWMVDTYIDGDAASAVNLEEQPTIEFDDAGAVSIFGGCNDGGGEYSIDGSTISFGDLFSTDMACEEDIMFAENHIFGTLAGDLNFSIDGDRLTIQGDVLGISATAGD